MIDGLILAGGQSLRMGCDKAGLMVAGKTLLQHQMDSMCPEVGRLFIAGNAESANISAPNVAVVADFFKDFEGPLSGALGALQASDASFLWIMPCDSFGFNALLKEQLLGALHKSGADIAYLVHEGNAQPLLAVWRTSVKPELLVYLQAGERSVLKWYGTMHAVAVECNVAKGQCCNMNTPADFQALLNSV